MAASQPKYQKMPGRSILPFDAKRLWQAQDHLLYVETFYFVEHYKRFYYNDIQSLVIQRTDTHKVWSFAWGTLSLLFGISALWVTGIPYITGTLFTVFILALVANLLMGPSCIVYLQTAVQLQKLSSLRRIRVADKVVTRIKALVEDKQGRWEKQKSVEFHSAMSSGSNSAGQAVPRGVNDKIADEPVPKGPYKPLLHQILFGLLTLMGILGAVQVFLKSLPIGLLGILLHGIVQMLVMMTIVRWFRHLKGTQIAKFCWMALVFITVFTIVGYVLFMVASIRSPGVNYHHWSMYKMVFEIQMNDHPLALIGNIIYAGGNLLLGAFGMLVVQRSS